MGKFIKFLKKKHVSIRKKIMIPLLGSFLLFFIIYTSATQVLIKSNFREFKGGVIDKVSTLKGRTQNNIHLLSQKTRLYYKDLSEQLEMEKENVLSEMFKNSSYIAYTFEETKRSELRAKAQVLTKLKEVEYLIGNGIVESGNLHKKGSYFQQTFVQARGLTAIYKLANNIKKRMWPKEDTIVDVKIFLYDGKVVGKSRRTNYSSFSDIYVEKNIADILNEEQELIEDIAYSPTDGLAYQVYVPIKDSYNVVSGGMIITYPLNVEHIGELANYLRNEVVIFDREKLYASTFDEGIELSFGKEIFGEIQDKGKFIKEFEYDNQFYKAIFYPLRGRDDVIMGAIGYAIGLKDLTEELKRIGRQQAQSLYLLEGLKLQSLELFENDIENISSYLHILEQSLNNITLRIILLLLGIALVYAFLTVAYISKILIEPLCILSRGVTKIRKGKYGDKVEISSNDELGHLAKGFNKMNIVLKENFEQIHEQKNVLQDLNKTLEEKVAIRTENIEKQKVELEKQNKEITDSILYAESIQNSILPKNLDLLRKTKEHFVIWKPRDIVGGDFYWFKELGEGFFLALIDCTGHGVPGALMSMKVEALINRITSEEYIDNPAGVLKELNHMLKHELYHDSTNEKIDEGLDIALCFINEKSNILSYAGARISLYYSDNLELFELKPDKQSIGYRRSKLSFEYTNHYLEITSKRNFYMTTDGYPDQNNSINESFGKQRFSETLESSFHLSMNDQRQLLEEILESYKNNEKQRDDITVIGFNI